MDKTENYEKDRFGRDLTVARERAGMNSPELAKALDVTNNAVRKWESGESFPRPKMWAAIKNATGINPQDYRVYPAMQQSIITRNKSHDISGGMTITNNKERRQEMSLEEQYLIKLLRQKDTTKKYINEFIKKLLSLDE